ncbi:hypothetical protein [Tropheryma whipplei]|uniref:Uncharacterized protein n=1 Tax=Tropheryma whipplei (strain Twist) TaxID=203267 RepID=Q83GW2_TROWT|nr:hypothetical protein [Tropheryma whipplei]AAO44216.1 unknown [Tropheryma whipplei str. Twist]MCO8182869.1 hypothetical protein [Tropheryma whipplei]MCO8190428.1 hypothetical protein [Tropheryma whipplei]
MSSTLSSVTGRAVCPLLCAFGRVYEICIVDLVQRVCDGRLVEEIIDGKGQV